MRLFEISAIKAHDYPGGKKALSSEYFPTERLKAPRHPLGIDNLTYSIFGSPADKTLKLTVWDESVKQTAPRWFTADQRANWPGAVVAKAMLEKHWLPVENAMEVATVTVDEDYAGKGVAQMMYALLLQKEKLTLVSGEAQTPAGRALWAKLASNANIDITGWVAIDVEHNFVQPDSKVVHKLQDDLFGKLGAQHLGTVDRRASTYEFFQFPVEKTANSKKLKALITKAIGDKKAKTPDVGKIYGGDVEFTTGLMAKWIGA